MRVSRAPSCVAVVEMLNRWLTEGRSRRSRGTPSKATRIMSRRSGARSRICSCCRRCMSGLSRKRTGVGGMARRMQRLRCAPSGLDIWTYWWVFWRLSHYCSGADRKTQRIQEIEVEIQATAFQRALKSVPASGEVWARYMRFLVLAYSTRYPLSAE